VPGMTLVVEHLVLRRIDPKAAGVTHPSSVGLATMAPVTGSKIFPPVVLVGSRFGSNHGLTQMGATGIVVSPKAFIPEGLYASAVADAPAVNCVRPQTRAKKVGRVLLKIVTFISGSVPTPAPALGKLTVTSLESRLLSPDSIIRCHLNRNRRSQTFSAGCEPHIRGI
jgi:hypothetical protein